MACVICERIEGVRRGEEPFLIAELAETIVVLHEHQPFAGWCVLWVKEHVEHLDELPPARQGRIWDEVSRVAGAVRGAMVPRVRRLNYACLCNLIPHVHWHVIPRYADDPAPLSAVWARPDEELECGVEVGRRDDLIRLIKGALE